MTNQELRQDLFNRSLAHLRKQGEPAIIKTDTSDPINCWYRTPTGCSCAIGGLIKDEFYSAEFEGETVEDPRVMEAVANSLDVDLDHFNEDIKNFLTDLQAYLHDDFGPHLLYPEERHFPTWLEQQAERFAQSYNLNFPAKDTSA